MTRRPATLSLLPPFRHLSDLELQGLSDDALIDRVRRARDAGEFDAAKLALSVLVFGHMDNVERRVRLKVPSPAVEFVASNAMVSAITAAFNGQSPGEFHSWLHTIVDRRIADYHRRGRVDQVPLPDEHVGDATVWGQLPGVEDETGTVEVGDIVEQLLAELSAVHRDVVELAVFDQLSAADISLNVAAKFPAEKISADNVYKIAQRFRDSLRRRLESEQES
jgi:DNA-directed RNA polymerase specialized sigma24 family protein